MLQIKQVYFMFVFLVFDIEGACDKSLTHHKNYHLLSQRPDCGRRSVRRNPMVAGRILKGTPGYKGEFPWLVHVDVKEKTIFGKFRTWCGGALINDRYVITAAHCFASQGRLLEQRWTVLLGQWKRSDTSDVEQIPLETATCHKGFRTRDFHNDICLLRMDRTITFTRFIKPICLPFSCFWQEKDLECYDMTIAGWGYVQVKPTEVKPDEFQKLRVEVKSQEYCEEQWQVKWKGKNHVQSTHVCAEADDKTRTGCPGDSGSPLVFESVIRNHSEFYLIGIVSQGWPCHRQNEGDIPPPLFTRVTSFLKWILDNIQE